jgi:hypothetical protein
VTMNEPSGGGEHRHQATSHYAHALWVSILARIASCVHRRGPLLRLSDRGSPAAFEEHHPRRHRIHLSLHLRAPARMGPGPISPSQAAAWFLLSRISITTPLRFEARDGAGWQFSGVAIMLPKPEKNHGTRIAHESGTRNLILIHLDEQWRQHL